MKNPKLVILFGSKVTGKSGAKSDTDIAILADHPLSLHEMSLISQRIAKKLDVSEDDIDIVDLQSASPLLQQEVGRHGKLIQGSEADFLRFRVLAWKRYQDTAKFRKIRAEYLEKTLHA